jgi:hypothetical protein
VRGSEMGRRDKAWLPLRQSLWLGTCKPRSRNAYHIYLLVADDYDQK